MCGKFDVKVFLLLEHSAVKARQLIAGNAQYSDNLTTVAIMWQYGTRYNGGYTLANMWQYEF